MMVQIANSTSMDLVFNDIDGQLFNLVSLLVLSISALSRLGEGQQ